MINPALLEAAKKVLSAEFAHTLNVDDLTNRVLTAVVPLIEAATLERAAKVAEEKQRWLGYDVAAAIRALKEPK